MTRLLEKATSLGAAWERLHAVRGAALRLALSLSVVLGAVPLPLCAQKVAWADEAYDAAAAAGASTGTATDVDAEPDEFQQKVEETAAAYDEATARVAELEGQIAENEQKLAEVESDLPGQQERAEEAMCTLYKMQQEGVSLVNLVLSAESLGDLLSKVDYLTYVHESNIAEVERLNALQAERDAVQQELEEQKAEADEQQAVAQQALEEAQAAREEAQRRAQEEAAREAAEAAAEAEALAQAAAAAAELAETRAENEAAAAEAASNESAAANEGDGGGESTGSIEAPSADGADWSSDKATFVAEWGARIDAYLAGSPLAGQGATFAEAAWTYGVDPRWSPAISCMESSKGLYCFKSHNAWGWGQSSWSSWEEAINAHVAGLARGYGYTISVSAAQKYCPPNWARWYEVVSAQMELI